MFVGTQVLLSLCNRYFIISRSVCRAVCYLCSYT